MTENRAVKFIKTTVVGGLLFLVPVVFLVFILSEAMDYMLVVAEPMADWIPVDMVGGVALANLIAIVIMILICFIAGLVGRNAVASGLVKKLESKVLMKIPGCSLVVDLHQSILPVHVTACARNTLETIKGARIEKASII